VVEQWSDGVVEWWSGGVVEWWSNGAVIDTASGGVQYSKFGVSETRTTGAQRAQRLG